MTIDRWNWTGNVFPDTYVLPSAMDSADITVHADTYESTDEFFSPVPTEDSLEGKTQLVTDDSEVIKLELPEPGCSSGAALTYTLVDNGSSDESSRRALNDGVTLSGNTVEIDLGGLTDWDNEYSHTFNLVAESGLSTIPIGFTVYKCNSLCSACEGEFIEGVTEDNGAAGCTECENGSIL